jgi:hypothetical protein
MTNQRLAARITKTLNSKIKGKIKQLENRQRTLIDISPERTYRMANK